MLPQVSIFMSVLRIDIATWQHHRRRRVCRRLCCSCCYCYCCFSYRSVVILNSRLPSHPHSRFRPRLVFASDLFLYSL